MRSNILRLFFSVLVLVLVSLNSCSLARSDTSFNEEEVTFQNDGLTLSGVLRIPINDDPVPLLILYHAASGGSSSFPFYEHFKTDLPERGIATFTYDRRGSNAQPGAFETATFMDLANDGIAAAKVLTVDPRIDSGRIGAWGISQGGWVAPLAANISEDIAFAISVSGPGVTPSRQMTYTAEYHLREAGFSDEIVDTALELRASMDAYYRAPIGNETLQKKLTFTVIPTGSRSHFYQMEDTFQMM